MTDLLQPASGIALLSSSNLQLLAPVLRKELRNGGWTGWIWQSGFNQYRQDIANAESPLYSQRPEVVILHLDGEDLFADWLRNPFLGGTGERLNRARQAIAELESWVGILRGHLPEALVVLNTVCLPPIHACTGLEYHSPWGLSDLATEYNAGLPRIAEKYPGVVVNDVAALAGYTGYRQWFDARLWHLARCRLSADAMNVLARHTAALLRAWKGTTRKCLVLDLDNTLWGGIVGEDGVPGIVLAEEGPGLAFVEFQEELLNLCRKGVLLAICSKNNEEDALEALRSHPSMRLREDAFAARRIDWQDKAANLRELALELNIGLDSFVFIDDNPVERALVRSTLPEVFVPEWPREPSEFKAALLELAGQYFLRVSITPEDQARTAMYRARDHRQTLEAAGGSLEDYYCSLQMRARIGYADRFSVPRIAQLTQKTNQFNLTTRRYTEADIQSLVEASDALVMWLRLRDRFADDGLIGVLILRQVTHTTWKIDTFLLSCRVIGRTAENAFLEHACQVLRERGAAELIGEYLPTPKNSLAANVYRDLGFTMTASNQERTTWRLAIGKRHIPVPGWIELETVEGDSACLMRA